jgi:DNA end-binding protein Ku
MPRALWKGAISFGLVNVPVELYPAEDRKAFSFAMLDKRDFSPVGYKRFSKKTGKEVEWGNIVKGYEYEKDQYVVLSEEDFRQANVKATQTIDIQAFVNEAEVGAEYFETPYFLAPAGRGQKAYALLRETLRESGLIGIAQVVIRTKEHLAALHVSGRALMLITLRYADEMRDGKGLELPAEGLAGAKVSPKEVALAKRLVDDMTEKWKPATYHSTYHADLMRRIKLKVKQGKTREITAPEKDDDSKPHSAQVIDLAELLRQSLGKGSATKKNGKVANLARAKVVGTIRPAAKLVARPKAKPKAAAARRKSA